MGKKPELLKDKALKNLKKQYGNKKILYKAAIKVINEIEQLDKFSSPELILYTELKRRGLPVEHHVRINGSNSKYYQDFEADIFIDFTQDILYDVTSKRHFGIDIECDGYIWHGNKRSRLKDQRRDKDMAYCNILTLRIREDDINNNVITTGEMIAEVYNIIKQKPEVLKNRRFLKELAKRLMYNSKKYKKGVANEC